MRGDATNPGDMAPLAGGGKCCTTLRREGCRNGDMARAPRCRGFAFPLRDPREFSPREPREFRPREPRESRPREPREFRPRDPLRRTEGRRPDCEARRVRSVLAVSRLLRLSSVPGRRRGRPRDELLPMGRMASRGLNKPAGFGGPREMRDRAERPVWRDGVVPPRSNFSGSMSIKLGSAPASSHARCTLAPPHAPHQ